ncbi:MAG: hypothetical protein WCA31_02735, partial [Acidimicrobiales bacterium]
NAAVLKDRSAPGHAYVQGETIETYRSHMLERFAVGESDLAITYTPLHGVGGEVMTALFRDAGYRRVTTVDRQFAPDPLFPTLPFPNPEEPGALDLAMETANASGSSVIIANDPDADRLGAAVRHDDGWRVLRGDEIGWLLASALAGEIRLRGEVVATTIVSSTMLSTLAREWGVRCATTLTGFKWIARAAGERVLGFGYEEALGFAVDPLVADKDGLSAALALARLAHELSLNGRTLLDQLDELESKCGVHATSQLAIRAEGPNELARLHHAVEQLRVAPPRSLGELPVTEVIDLGQGFRDLPPTEGVWFTLANLGRVVVRPSGTEAKVKAYLEITPAREGSLAEQRARAAALAHGVRESLDVLLRA